MLTAVLSRALPADASQGTKQHLSVLFAPAFIRPRALHVAWISGPESVQSSAKLVEALREDPARLFANLPIFAELCERLTCFPRMPATSHTQRKALAS